MASGIQPSDGICVDELYGGTLCITKDCDVRRGVPVQVTAGSTTADIDFSLVSGAVSDAFTTAQQVVDLRRARSRARERDSQAVSLLRSSNRSPGVPPGIYYAKYGDVLHGGIVCHDCPPTSGTPIVVRPGDVSIGPLNFVATPVRHVRGSVTDAAGGAPLSTITVEVVSGAGQVVAKTTTDLAGTLFGGPDSARHVLRAHVERPGLCRRDVRRIIRARRATLAWARRSLSETVRTRLTSISRSS